ncbi:tyrosyl-DNA phosphodiesterase domain-containing protein [Sarocladium implicatum]|nr:tyrosyl-DNA phosphodiesterase domain-containing protein [Sarocladium implicatum]
MAESIPDVITLSSDSEDDEDLKRAIALSLMDQETASEAGSETASDTSKVQEPEGDAKVKNTHDQPQETRTAATGLLALDRKQMEKERLARIAKRSREDSNDREQNPVSGAPPPKKQITEATSSVLVSRPAATATAPPAVSTSSISDQSSKLPYPRGVVKRTWAYGYPRTNEDIKIEEVFQRNQLQLAIFSSYQWDEDWLMSKVDISKTKLVLVAYAADEAQKQAMRDNTPSNIRFCFPPMNGPGAMHSKLQLLKFPEYLRIVIPTGNLVPYDWGETGVMENMVFLLDVPRLANSTSHAPTRFSTQLDYFLRASAIDEKMVDSLRSYDFSATASLGFVYSIPGGHLKEARGSQGYCGLGASAAALGITPTEPIEIDLVCSSLGAINPDLIQAIYNACQGDDGMLEYEARVNRKPANKPLEPPDDVINNFRIYFPTDRTVRQSRGGRAAGGTICAQEKWWRAPNFPRQLVRDCVNTREGLLMHSKLIFVRRKGHASNSASGQCTGGFAYVGSANLSESAWGRLVKDRATGQPKINCRNWECGVVLPAVGSSGPDGADDLAMFADYVPVPMRFPGPMYGVDEMPWFFRGD